MLQCGSPDRWLKEPHNNQVYNERGTHYVSKDFKKGICILTSFCILLHFTSIITYANDEITTFTQNEKFKILIFY